MLGVDSYFSEQNILGKVNKGIYVLFSGLDIERVLVAFGAIGCDNRQQK